MKTVAMIAPTIIPIRAVVERSSSGAVSVRRLTGVLGFSIVPEMNGRKIR
jgi:hypothetical protein